MANIYRETGREEEGWNILHDLATLDVYDVKVPDYVGPYREMNAPERVQAERVDDARIHAAGVRESARRRLISWSIVPGDPAKSTDNLRQLIDRYEGTEIEPILRKAQVQAVEQLIRSLEQEVP